MDSPAEGFRAYWGSTPWKGDWTAADDRVGEFYVPLLARAQAYDRMAGYFTSSALSLAAAGLSSFVAHGGRMRLIVGAQLDPADVEAIERGEPLPEAVARALLREAVGADEIGDSSSAIAEHRRAVLGWLVREGRLEIKVGVPVDPRTRRPLRPEQTSAYFHSKYGVFTDWADPADRVAFIGSGNETWQGWTGNHETFATAPTWREQTWADLGAGLVARFEAHWHDRPDEGWCVMDLHEAVRDRLVSWAPAEAAPAGPDPEARRRPGMTAEPPVPTVADPALLELAAAPSRDGGTFVGLSTAGVEPLPHQVSLVRRAIESWPRGYFLADEVPEGPTLYLTRGAPSGMTSSGPRSGSSNSSTASGAPTSQAMAAVTFMDAPPWLRPTLTTLLCEHRGPLYSAACWLLSRRRTGRISVARISVERAVWANGRPPSPIWARKLSWPSSSAPRGSCRSPLGGCRRAVHRGGRPRR
ncbi:MAG: phospholipase D-like domain-containing protein [Actinomycetota bacterium]|nr:phospholipase D-like domain-containing protein [Actinomycetota bacterium]